MSRKDTPVIIEAAINGMTSKEKNPNAPRTPEEISTEALLCLELGATIIHVHNSDIELTGRAAADDYLAAWRPRLREATRRPVVSDAHQCPRRGRKDRTLRDDRRGGAGPYVRLRSGLDQYRRAGP